MARMGTYIATIVPSEAARIVSPRHSTPDGSDQCSSTPVVAGGGAVVEVDVGGGTPGGVSSHCWSRDGPH
jgi:hypothetical protein